MMDVDALRRILQEIFLFSEKMTTPANSDSAGMEIRESSGGVVIGGG
jgi:hypothetical protein